MSDLYTVIGDNEDDGDILTQKSASKHGQSAKTTSKWQQDIGKDKSAMQDVSQARSLKEQQ